MQKMPAKADVGTETSTETVPTTASANMTLLRLNNHHQVAFPKQSN